MTNFSVRTRANRTVLLVCIVAGLVAGDGLTTSNTTYAQGRGRGIGRALNALTGTFQLNPSLSDNPATVADRVTRTVPGPNRDRLRNAILRRLEAPDMLAIERQGRTITLASSRAARVTFEVDGQPQTEVARNGGSIRTVTTLVGDRLEVSTEGDRSLDFRLTFEPVGNGLRVTREVSDEGLPRPVVSRSVYDRVSDDPRLDMYSESRGGAYPRGAVDRNDRGDSRDAGRGRDPGEFGVPEGTEIVATLDDDLSTRETRPEDPFTLTVRSPAQFEGARIDGRIGGVNRTGRVSGRAEMAFDFQRISLRSGRAFDFNGYLENIRTTNGDTLRVEGEATARDEGSQTGRTATRTGIGAAIGALIGAAAGGGKGAAIGAAVGAGAGAGSVLVEGRDELELLRGAEFRIRAVGPR